MPRKLRVLIVEDVAADAELVTLSLAEGGYDVVSEVVATEDAYVAALGAPRWDVILCDHNLPQFNSITALKLLQAHGQDIPFIIVSGAIGEEAAVAAMKAGASDYVMKDRLARLAPAIEREIRETAARREQRRSEAALLLNEARLAGIVDSAMDAVISIGGSQRVVIFNRAAEAMFGYATAEMLEQPIDRLLPERYHAAHGSQIQAFARTGVTSRAMGNLRTLFGKRRNGEEFPIEVTISQVDVSGEQYFTVIIRDVTERVKAQKQMAAALHEKDVLLREVHHRVNNNMNVVYSLLSFHSRTTVNQEAAAILKEAGTRVQTMALVHNELYGMPDVGSIDFPTYVQRLLEELEQAYVRQPGQIALNLIADPMRLELETAIPCSLLLHELVTNALKHAFPAGRTGEIEVRLQTGPDDLTTIAVKDDGVGLPPDVNYRAPATMGLDIVQALVGQLGGTLQVETEGGTCFGVTFAARSNAE